MKQVSVSTFLGVRGWRTCDKSSQSLECEHITLRVYILCITTNEREQASTANAHKDEVYEALNEDDKQTDWLWHWR